MLEETIESLPEGISKAVEFCPQNFAFKQNSDAGLLLQDTTGDSLKGSSYEVREVVQFRPQNIKTETTSDDEHIFGESLEGALIAKAIPLEDINKMMQFSPLSIKAESNSDEDYNLSDIMGNTNACLTEVTPHDVFSEAVNFVVSSTKINSVEEDTLSDCEMSVSSFLECQLEILHSNEVVTTELDNTAKLHSNFSSKRSVRSLEQDGEHSIFSLPVCSKMKTRNNTRRAKIPIDKKEMGSAKYGKTKKANLEIRTCTLCEKVFKNVSHLKIHNRIHTGEKPFDCQVCHKSFRQKCHLVDHERLHLNDPAAGKSFVCSLNGCYTCIICGKVFQGSWKIESHLRVHTGEKPYECDICHKHFKQKGHLSDHKKIHSDFKEFKCGFCPKEFYSYKTQAYHELKTHGEKNHVCPICGHAFSRRCDLATHLRTHS